MPEFTAPVSGVVKVEVDGRLIAATEVETDDEISVGIEQEDDDE